jgi:hypothetical protein
MLTIEHLTPAEAWNLVKKKVLSQYSLWDLALEFVSDDLSTNPRLHNSGSAKWVTSMADTLNPLLDEFKTCLDEQYDYYVGFEDSDDTTVLLTGHLSHLYSCNNKVMLQKKPMIKYEVEESPQIKLEPTDDSEEITVGVDPATVIQNACEYVDGLDRPQNVALHAGTSTSVMLQMPKFRTILPKASTPKVNPEEIVKMIHVPHAPEPELFGYTIVKLPAKDSKVNPESEDTSMDATGCEEEELEIDVNDELEEVAGGDGTSFACDKCSKTFKVII